MARDAQTRTVNGEYIVLEGGGVTGSILPYALMAFRDTFTLDGSGGADTADCRITLPLPSNNVWQLSAFHVDLVSDQIIEYDEGILELYYAPSSTEFGQSTQLNFPLAPGAEIFQPTVTPTRIRGFDLADRSVNSSSVVSGGYQLTSPFNLLSFNDASAGADPVIWLSGGGNNGINGASCNLAVTFLGYTQEQATTAGLFTGWFER